MDQLWFKFDIFIERNIIKENRREWVGTASLYIDEVIIYKQQNINNSNNMGNLVLRSKQKISKNVRVYVKDIYNIFENVK